MFGCRTGEILHYTERDDDDDSGDDDDDDGAVGETFFFFFFSLFFFFYQIKTIQTHIDCFLLLFVLFCFSFLSLQTFPNYIQN